MRLGVMVGAWWSCAWCVWPVPGIFGALVGAGVLTAVVSLPVRRWSPCRHWAAACAREWVPLCVTVAPGVGALGAWLAWLSAGARVDVYLVRVAGGLWAAGVLLPCVWRFVLSGGAWLVCALCGWCGAWSAWLVPVWVFGVRCWLCVRHPRGVVGRDSGFSDVRGRLVVGVVGGVVSVAGG